MSMTLRFSLLLATFALLALVPQQALAQANSFSTAPASTQAPLPNAAPQTLQTPAGGQVLTQSATQEVTQQNSVSCNSAGNHTDNSYYRLFDLDALGVTGDFQVSNVRIGVEQATGNGGTQPIELRLSTLSGPFVVANLTRIATVPVSIADQSLSLFDIAVPDVTIPAGSMLVVEIFTPNGQSVGNRFFIGSNADGQTAPSYIRAPNCNVDEPTSTADIGRPNMHIVMSVTGTSQPLACAVGTGLSFEDSEFFDTDGNPEIVPFTNLSDTPIDLNDCSFAVFDPFTEQVTFVQSTLDTVIPPSAPFVIGYNSDIVPDGPGAVVFVEGPLAVGASVADVLPNLVTGMVYRSEDDVLHIFSSFEATATSSETFLAALASLAQPVASEDDAAGDLALTVSPNPIASHGTVAFELPEAADVSVALYDALGRQVASLADAPYGAGRHSLELATADLPTGVYVVRAQFGETVRTTRLTVVR